MLTRTRMAMLAAAAALAMSLPTLRNGFAIDDLYVFVDQPMTHSLGNIPRFFSAGWGMGTSNPQERALNTRYYRPLATTLGAVEHAVFGLRPWGYHLTSAILFAATAALVTLLLWQLTGGRALATLMGGLLFAVHPVQSEAFSAACYQTVLLAGLFGTLTLLLFGRILEEGARPVRLLALGTSLFLALLSKEEAFAIPLLAWSWAALLRPPRFRRALLTSAIPMAVAVGLVLFLRNRFLSPSHVTYFGDEPAMVVVLTMVRVAGLYLELLVAPLRLCPFYDWFIIGHETGLSNNVLLGASVLALAVVIIAYCRTRAPRVALGLAWILLALLPVSQLVPIIVVAAERFLYLPMLGVCVLVGLGLERGLERATTPRLGKLAVASVVILLSLFALRTLTRVPDWRNDETLNLATARMFPETPTPFLNLATHYERAEHNPAKALAALDQALRRVPDWKPALVRRVRLLGGTGSSPLRLGQTQGSLVE